MAILDVLLLCRERWAAGHIACGDPIPADEIARTWERLGMTPSVDVLELYGFIGGWKDYVCDDDFLFALWPWDWLIERNSERERSGILFCDHSIEVVTWELRFVDSRHSSVWLSDGRQVAATLEEFFRQYLRDPWQLM